jgi:hypothetical protein
MKKAGAVRAIAVAAGLAGCSALDPYPTYPRQPEANAHDKGPRVAICYDPLVTAAAQVRQAAQRECAADSLATHVDTDFLLLYCPLLLPARATFVCAPKTKQ